MPFKLVSSLVLKTPAFLGSRRFSYSGNPKSIPKLVSSPLSFNKREQLCFRCGFYGIPKTKLKSGFVIKDSQCYGSGEDTSFCRTDALGVADGVGGWSLKGGNSTFYSRKLISNICLELDRYDDIESDRFSEYYSVSPVQVIDPAYKKTNAEALENNIRGSTTLCLALLRKNILKVSNLGDCGLYIIRNNSFAFRSEEQQHSFNFPYQLGINSRDKPKVSNQYEIKVSKGDIVLLSSDGLFDNLFDEEILEQINEYSRLKTFDPYALSIDLAKRARSVAEDPRCVSTPFQNRAVQEGLYFQGGKLDDISVVVGVVDDIEGSPDRR